MTRSIKQKLALQKMAGGVGLRETARSVGVGKSTLSRWVADPEFQAELDALVNQSLTEIREHTINAQKILATATEKASIVLLELLDSQSETIKLHAAKLILEKVTLPEPNLEAQKIEEGKLSFQDALKKISSEVYGIANV